MYIQQFNKVCIKDYALYVLANRLTSGMISTSLCSVFLIYKAGRVMIISHRSIGKIN